MANIVLTDSQQVLLGPCNAFDKAGNPAPFEANPVWTSSDTAIVGVTDNGDGTALAFSVGPLGSASVKAEVDADLGAGFVPISESLDFSVIAGQATSLNMVVGTPSEKP